MAAVPLAGAGPISCVSSSRVPAGDSGGTRSWVKCRCRTRDVRQDSSLVVDPDTVSRSATTSSSRSVRSRRPT
ncbi:hypothetical protein ACWGKQ_29670 [Streptomyces sp. NPDC054770]